MVSYALAMTSVSLLEEKILPEWQSSRLAQIPMGDER